MGGRTFVDRLLRYWSPLIEFLSGEKLLTATPRANGGAIILLRTLFITIWLYALAVLLKQVLDPDRIWDWSTRALRSELRDTLPWAGAIFAAVYASLYTRFSSQWLYLAGLYNQIKAVEARTAGTPDARTIVAEWKAGFLEDAAELHLATKGLFASVWRLWGQDAAVKEYFIRNTFEGDETFAYLMGRVNETYARHGERKLARLRRAEQTATVRAVENSSPVVYPEAPPIGARSLTRERQSVPDEIPAEPHSRASLTSPPRVEAESLRVQLTELNNRSRAYTAQIWQVPFAYVGIVGVVLAQLADKDPRVKAVAMAAAAAFGVPVLIHLTSLANGCRRAVENIRAVERKLYLTETAQYRPAWYIAPLIGSVILTVLFCSAGAIYLFDSATKGAVPQATSPGGGS